MTPAPGFRGDLEVTYTVGDGAGGQDTATLTVTVSNATPVAVDDSTTTDDGTPVDVDVLGNDVDPNGDPLTVTEVGLPTGPDGLPAGVAEVTADGVRFTPANGFSGTATFTYTISDGNGGTDTATVTVVVADAPPVARDDAETTDRATPVTVDVLANDDDPNGDPLAIVGISGLDPAQGSARVDDGGTPDDPTDDTIVFTPDPGFSGDATFSYTVSDGRGGRSTADVVVTVGNGTPVAADDEATTSTDEPVDVDLLGNDTDPDGDDLTVTATTTPAHGTVAVGADGTATYTPDEGYAGPDSFDYTVSDGHGGTATATVTLTVRNAPPVGVDDERSTPAGTPIGIDVLTNDTDPNIPGTDQVLRVVAVDQPDVGGTATVDLDGGGVTFTPAPGFKGDATFTYTLDDGAGGQATATVLVHVANGAPVAVDDAASTPSGRAVTVDVLGNDSDPNGDAISIVPGSLTPPVGTDGTVRGTVSIVAGQVRYVPPAGFRGDVTFDYTITDTDGTQDTATVTITVGNAPPTARPDSRRTPVDTPVRIDVLANDSDPNRDALTITSVTGGRPGSRVRIDDNGTPDDPSDDRIVYTPPPGFSGVDELTYTISDGFDGTSTATVRIVVPSGEVLGEEGNGPNGGDNDNNGNPGNNGGNGPGGNGTGTGEVAGVEATAGGLSGVLSDTGAQKGLLGLAAGGGLLVLLGATMAWRSRRRSDAG